MASTACPARPARSRFAGRTRSALPLVVVMVAGVGAPALLPRAAASDCPAPVRTVLSSVPSPHPQAVALTFDDGPSPKWTPQVLDILHRLGVRATFFVNGSHVDAFPALARRIVDEGHTIGNHTYSHRNLDPLPAAAQAAEVDRTTQAIVAATGVRPCFFRGPYGSHHGNAIKSIVWSRGMSIVGWSHDTRDYQTPLSYSPAFQQTVVGRATVPLLAGPLVLMHDGAPGNYRQNTVDAVERIVTSYASKGYVFTDPAGRLAGSWSPVPQTGALDAVPGPVAPAPLQPAATRLAGADRYATAAAIVADSFPAGPVPVVLIVTGAAFADALAGGPAADALGGPVLPVAEAGIPAPILSELNRLDPARIVVLGGPSAVSDAILTELQSSTSGTVTRLAGTNRYDTAAKVATSGAFPVPAPQVLIATGQGFADALAGGAAGALTASPVLLVGPNGIPAETAAALTALRPKDIAVLGGTTAVSDVTVEQLRGYTTGGVNRLAGASRYETATRVAQVFWPATTDVVYLASGLNSPDALAGVPAAGRDSAPLLLVDPTCMPAVTRAEIDRLQPGAIVVLGGQAAVSDAAASGASC